MHVIDAAWRGDVDALERETEDSWDVTVTWAAAKRGQLAALEFLLARGAPHDALAPAAAAEHGHHECLRLLHAMGCKWDTYTCDMAARSGSLWCLRYAAECGCPLNPVTCALLAAEGGHLDCLEYAYHRGAPRRVEHMPRTMQLAARGGHVACVQFALAHGFPENDACRAAASGGQLGCLHVLHEHGCPWDEHVTEAAAAAGSVACLAYAHEHGCPWNAAASAAAWRAPGAAPGYACLQYIALRGGPVDPETPPDVRRRHVSAVRARHILWPLVRAGVLAPIVRARIFWYWYESAQRSACAPGGAGRERDRAAYEAEMAPYGD